MVTPNADWLIWLEEMRLPEQHEGESDDEWTARIHNIGHDQGRFRQCSIGWHDECSDRGNGECECPCHRYDKQDLANALRELEGEVAVLRDLVSIEAGTCRCGANKLATFGYGGGGSASTVRHTALDGSVSVHTPVRCWAEVPLKPRDDA